MKAKDKFSFAVSNLKKNKLRSILTILGVVIGIASLASMLSFGIGLQDTIEKNLKNSDLFTTLRVTKVELDLNKIGKKKKNSSKENKKDIALNDSLVLTLAKIEHVKNIVPQYNFSAKLSLNETEFQSQVCAVPSNAKENKSYNDLLEGNFFFKDSDQSVLINPNSFEDIGFLIIDKENEAGQKLYAEKNELKILPFDSVKGKVLQFLSVDLSTLASSFGIPGISFSKPKPKIDNFVITGLMKKASGPSITQYNFLIPIGSSKKLSRIGFSRIWDVFSNKKNSDKNDFDQIEIKVSNITKISEVKANMEKMGLNVFSFADQFEEIKRIFLFVNGILAAIGSIALIVAALGISNTMIMSILERTKEIGIMKALGAEEKEIKLIFFYESIIIGIIGSIFGLILASGITKIASIIINTQIPSGDKPIQMFVFNWWLVLGSILFSIIISLLAGMYPAGRAANIDPIKALRHE